MSTAKQVPGITVEQYEQFEGYPGLRDELIRGESVMAPQPKALHQEIAEQMHDLLRSVIGSDWVVKQNTNIRLPELNSMPAPDVFVVPREAWYRAVREEQYLQVAPILAVEVLSAANRRRRIEQKIEIYLAAGTAAVYVLDPKRRVLRLRSVSTDRTYRQDEVVTLPAPLTGTVDVSAIFGWEEHAAEKGVNRDA